MTSSRVVAAFVLLSSSLGFAGAVPKSPAHRAVTQLRWTARKIDRGMEVSERLASQHLVEGDRVEGRIKVEVQRVSNNRSTQTGIALLGLLMGAPLVTLVGAVKSNEDGTRLAEMNKSLVVSRNSEQMYRVLLKQDRARRHILDKAIRVLSTESRTVVHELDVLSLRTGQPFENAAALRAHREAAQGIESGLAHQVAALTGLAESMKPLAKKIARFVDEAQTHLARAQQLRKDSDQAVVDSVMMMVSGDPEVAAQKWIDKKLTSKITDLLVQSGLKGDAGKEVAKQIAKRLVKGGKTVSTPDDDASADAMAAEIGDGLDAEG